MTTTLLSPSDRSVATEITKRLVAAGQGRVRRVILYGSRTDGSAEFDSDFDLLVLESEVRGRRREAQRLWNSLDEMKRRADVRVMRLADFESTRSTIGGLAYPAAKYGVVLYDVTG